VKSGKREHGGGDIDAIERALVLIRRSQTRRTLGREAFRRFGSAVRPSELAVVDAVEEGPNAGWQEVTVGDVARRLGVDASRASRLVAAAIRAGHVRRVASQEDARRTGLELTDRGRELASGAHAFRKHVFGEVMAGWSERERHQFARLLTRFVEGLGHATRDRASSAAARARRA